MAEMSGISALRAQRVEEASPSLTSTPRTRKAEMPEIRGDRWSVIVALMCSPARTSRRLAASLDALPTERRVVLCRDDVQRRPGAGRRASADLPPGASASGGCSSDTGRARDLCYPLTKPRV